MNTKKVLFFVTFLLQRTPVGGKHGGVGADCRLHPLIHTLLEFTLSQDIESIKEAEQVKERDEEKDRTHS